MRLVLAILILVALTACQSVPKPAPMEAPPKTAKLPVKVEITEEMVNGLLKDSEDKLPVDLIRFTGERYATVDPRLDSPELAAAVARKTGGLVELRSVEILGPLVIQMERFPKVTFQKNTVVLGSVKLKVTLNARFHYHFFVDSSFDVRVSNREFEGTMTLSLEKRNNDLMVRLKATELKTSVEFVGFKFDVNLVDFVPLEYGPVSILTLDQLKTLSPALKDVSIGDYSFAIEDGKVLIEVKPE